MTARKGLAGVSNSVLQAALRDLQAEAYTNARKFTGTGMVSGNSTIDVSTETFVGQLRWEQPLTGIYNVGSVTDATAGTKTYGNEEMLTYIKTTRAVGTDVKKLARVLTQKDGLSQFSRDQTELRTQDEHNSILSVLRGVAIAEALTGTGTGGSGGQTFSNDPESATHGFYVDLGAGNLVGAQSATSQGAHRAEGILKAFGMGFKDYEPEYAYLVANPALMADLRSANLVDADRVTDGNMDLETIFQGKFRLVKSRANMGLTSAEIAKLNLGSGTDITGTKLSYIVLPGAVAFKSLAVEDPVELGSDPSAYHGFGIKEMWTRWGYVAHPAGYTWFGKDDEFVDLRGYEKIWDPDGSGDWKQLADTVAAPTKGVWKRKAKSALTLGILPIFHA